ncbi:MAG TPA: glycosyl hydrolase family 28-related protein [Rhizomicrobium sp.]|nr:glycosyl hydrolase family 28-related protein [Rhizomicrobium sp.]
MTATWATPVLDIAVAAPGSPATGDRYLVAHTALNAANSAPPGTVKGAAKYAVTGPSTIGWVAKPKLVYQWLVMELQDLSVKMEQAHRRLTRASENRSFVDPVLYFLGQNYEAQMNIRQIFRILLLLVPTLAATQLAQAVPTTTYNVATIADLQALGSSSSTYGTVYVSDYATTGAGGGGTFVWNSGSTATADTCTIFAATGVGTGRWLRVMANGDQFSPQMCGAVANGSNDDTTAIQKALDIAAAKGSGVYCPTGTYKITSTITLPTFGYLSGPMTCVFKPSSAFPGSNVVVKQQAYSSILGIKIDGSNTTNNAITGLGCVRDPYVDTCQAPYLENILIENFRTTNSIGWDATDTNKAVGVSVNTDTNYTNLKMANGTANFNCFGCLWKSARSRNIWITVADRGIQEIHFNGGENVNAEEDGIYIGGTAGDCKISGIYFTNLHLETNWLSKAAGSARRAEFQATANDVCGLTFRDLHVEPHLGGSGMCDQQAKPLKIVSGRDALLDNPVVCYSGAGNITVTAGPASSPPTLIIANWPKSTNGDVGASLTTTGISVGCVLTNQQFQVTVAQLPPSPCPASTAVVSDATNPVTGNAGNAVAGGGSNEASVKYYAGAWRYN